MHFRNGREMIANRSLRRSSTLTVIYTGFYFRRETNNTNNTILNVLFIFSNSVPMYSILNIFILKYILKYIIFIVLAGLYKMRHFNLTSKGGSRGGILYIVGRKKANPFLQPRSKYKYPSRLQRSIITSSSSRHEYLGKKTRKANKIL